MAVPLARPSGSEGDSLMRALERRPIEILHEEAERVYVRGALRAGEAVVQSGVHRLVPGQLARLARKAEAALARVEPRREETVQ